MREKPKMGQGEQVAKPAEQLKVWKPRTAAELEQKRKEQDEVWRKMEERKHANKKGDGEKIAALKQQLGIKDPEQLREAVIQKALNEGGARLYTSVPAELSPSHNPGFTNFESRTQGWDIQVDTLNRITNQLRAPGRYENLALENELNSHGLTEIIDIRRKLKVGYETVTVPGKRGLLGFGGTSDRAERRPMGDVQPLHSEMVAGGKNEPAVRLSYFAKSSNIGREAAMGWKDYSGREGQMILFEIILPESVAKEAERELAADPGFMRTLVERYAKEKLLKNPSAWETPHRMGDSLRPPYERWDTKTNGKIYIQTDDKAPGWYNENIKQVRKRAS